MLRFVLGTRPEVIKLAPVIQECKRMDVPHEVLAVRQHTDLLDRHLEESGIQVDRVVELRREYLEDTTETTLLGEATAQIGRALGSGMVVVQGDTLTALAGAQAGFLSGCRVAHVEAGLRSTSSREPFPEEIARRLIAQLATVHFAPSRRAARNLIEAGIGGVFETGNPGLDHLKYLNRYEIKSGPILVTMHRRENWGSRLCSFATHLREIKQQVLWPAHPSQYVRIAADAVSDRVQVIGPIPHLEMLDRISKAKLVITDSGGVSEEAAYLGTRCLIMREHTERVELIDRGVAWQVKPDKWHLLAEIASEAMAAPNPEPCDVYGDGNAAPKIAKILKEMTCK